MVYPYIYKYFSGSSQMDLGKLPHDILKLVFCLNYSYRKLKVANLAEESD